MDGGRRRCLEIDERLDASCCFEEWVQNESYRYSLANTPHWPPPIEMADARPLSSMAVMMDLDIDGDWHWKGLSDEQEDEDGCHDGCQDDGYDMSTGKGVIKDVSCSGVGQQKEVESRGGFP